MYIQIQDDTASAFAPNLDTWALLHSQDSIQAEHSTLKAAESSLHVGCPSLAGASGARFGNWLRM